MRYAFAFLLLLTLLDGCKDRDADPRKVAAVITGYVIIDNWGQSCSTGGLQLAIGNETYTISNSLPAPYSDPNAWPAPVWVRFESDTPDNCTQSTNRIKILSIQKR
jgi:hypothetical protein